MSKYDEVLRPFVAMMEKELHANAAKGDRPGWLAMSTDTCLLEIFYHLGKLQKAVKKSEGDGIGEYAADVANMCMMLADICGVLAIAHPVPPAGGEPEVLGYSVKGNRYAIRLTKAELLELYEGYTGDALVELVDRAHVTRLQAEVERLGSIGRGQRKTIDNVQLQVERLQSELTKVRELLEEPFQLVFEGYNRPGTDFATDAAWATWQHAQLTKAFALLRKVCRPANQSAPADKNEECVHDFRMFSGECHKCGADWIPGKEYAPADKGQGEAVHECQKCYGHGSIPTRQPGECETEYRARCKSYAAQPAPVAVGDCDLKALMDRHEAWKAGEANGIASMVMPDRVTAQSHWPEWKISGSEGWNACLDELARLNPIKQ